MPREELLAFAHQYLERVKTTGNDNIMALCPFHDESTPSFAMSLTTGLFICFGCKESGGLHKLLRAFEISGSQLEIRFGGILKELAEARNDKFVRDPLRPEVYSNEPLPEEMLGLFQYVPIALEEEGFDEATLAHFDVGVDKTHNRITFPLRDVDGRFVGISGRAVDMWQQPRYKVYDKEYIDWGFPQRKLDKSEILWNYHTVFRDTHRVVCPKVVLVEGFKANMWVHQCGVPHVVASLGSFLSTAQKWMLEHLGAEVYVMYDNDAAGQKGTVYAARSLSEGLRVKIVQYDSDYHQPSDVPEDELHEALENAIDYYTWNAEQRQ